MVRTTRISVSSLKLSNASHTCVSMRVIFPSATIYLFVAGSRMVSPAVNGILFPSLSVMVPLPLVAMMMTKLSMAA